MVPEAAYYMGWVIQPLAPGVFCIYPRIDLSEPKSIIVQGTPLDACNLIDQMVGRK